MNTLTQRIAANRLKQLDRAEYEFAVSLATPAITDFDQIKNIVDFVVSKGYELNGTNAPLILGVVFRLTAKYKLHFDHLRTPTGLRDVCNR